MKRLIESLIAIMLFCGWFLVSHACFSGCLSDDVEFAYGKKRMRNRRKKQKGYWGKLLFLDVKDEVVPWHYTAFWVNLIASFIAIVALSVYVYSGSKSEPSRIVFVISGSVSFLMTAIISFVRWQLYEGNIVRCRKSYRKQGARRRRMREEQKAPKE